MCERVVPVVTASTRSPTSRGAASAAVAARACSPTTLVIVRAVLAQQAAGVRRDRRHAGRPAGCGWTARW